MADLSSSERFISEVTQQLIFKTFIESLSVNNESKLVSQNKLVCRDNLDLFFANENLVRCCTINSEYTNFRLLDNKYDDFKIRSLEMNSLGTLMALVGDKDLVVVSLPTSLTTSNSSLLPVKSYKIHGIEGHIKKVIWQSIISNDCCLVVLNDKSQIKSYDLSLSSYEPQLSIDLKEDKVFKDEEAVSFAFGSKSNLSGSLTLYVASSSSNIYAIYPFIHKLGKISTTESNVSDLLDESASIINAIQEKFPSKDLVKSYNQNVVNNASAKQYSYVLAFQKQFENSFPPRKEYRQLFAEKPIEYSILNQELPDDFHPALQGPISTLKDKSFKDIACINSNDRVSLLSSISVSATNEPFLSFHSQLKPLIMKWSKLDEEHTADVEYALKIKLEEKSTKLQPKNGYIKPKRGFGFIDEIELSDDSDKTDPAKIEQNDAKSRQTELQFWRDEFTALSTLAIDQIPIDGRNDLHLSILDSKESNVILKSNNTLIHFNCEKWCQEFVTNVSSGHRPKLNISNEYKLLVEGNEDISSFALTRDTINETGDFLIILKNKKENNLEIKQINGNNIPPRSIGKTDQNSIKRVVHESVLTKEPFDELKSQLENLRRVNPATLEKSLSMKKELRGVPICSSNTEILKNLNQLSNETIQQVSMFTSFAIHLNLRVTAQVDELKSQIDSISRIKTAGLDMETLNLKNDKANHLVSRQDKINERIEKIQEKIFNSIQKIKYSKSLPLSDAEKSWFREINSVNAQISQDTDDNKSLNSIIEGMTSQVSSIVKSIKEEENNQNPEDKLRNLETHNNILKLKQWLQEEHNLINLAKSKLDESFETLKI